MRRPFPWRTVLPCVLIGALFWAIYLMIGWNLASQHLLQNDLFFHSDVRRAADDMCRFQWRHLRTNVHPLFVLFTNPLGVPLSRILGDRDRAAVLLNSFVGGLGIGVFGFFLLAAGVSMSRAALLSGLLGCSTAHLFFGSAPETYAFSALSLMLLLCAALKCPGRLSAFVPAGLFSFGVLITNLATVAILFFTSLLQFNSIAQAMKRTALLLAGVAVIGTVLAGIQKLIWPQTVLFCLPSSYQTEGRFVKVPDADQNTINRERKLLDHVFVFDWFAPALQVKPERKREIQVRLESRSLGEEQGAGRAAMVLWFLVLGACSALALRHRLYHQPLFAAMLASLLFNLVLHTFYGDDFFLYGCNANLLVLGLVALASLALPPRPACGIAFNAALAVLLALQMANNLNFVRGLLSLQSA